MKKLALAAMISALPLMAQADTPSMEEMWQLIQSQQAEIKALKESAATQEAKLVVTEERLDITADTVEQVAANKSAGGAGASWFENTTIGGYGELHYNNLNDESNGGGDNTELDLHRFVLFCIALLIQCTRLLSPTCKHSFGSLAYLHRFPIDLIDSIELVDRAF